VIWIWTEAVAVAPGPPFRLAVCPVYTSVVEAPAASVTVTLAE